MLYDALDMKFRELKLRKNPECPVCGDNRTITELIDYHQFCGVPQQAAVEEPVSGEIEPTEVKAKQDRGDKFVLIDVREPHEYQIAKIPGAQLIPLGDLPKRLSELEPGRPVRDALQDGRPQREGLRFAAGERVYEGAEHEGRYHPPGAIR